MKYIKLHNRKKEVVARAIVDDEDYEWLNKYKWHVSSRGYAKTSVRKSKKLILNFYMHKMLTKAKVGYHTHHINENKLDNRKNNLASLDSKEHGKLTRLNDKPYGKIPYRGVHIKKKTKKGILLSVEIWSKGKTKHLGCGYDAKKLYEDLYVPAYIKEHGRCPMQ